MASKKADYNSLHIQDFVSKAQAMAYTNFRNEPEFDKWILPYVHVYRNSDGRSKGDYYIPELRKRKLELIEIAPRL